MPIANDKETKSFEDMISGELVPEACLGSEAFLPNGSNSSMFISSSAPSASGSNDHKPIYTSMRDCHSNTSNYQDQATENIMYELSSMLGQSQKEECYGRTDSNDQVVGHLSPDCGEKEAICPHRSHLSYHVRNGCVTGMKPELSDSLAQTNSSQHSQDTSMEYYVRDVAQFSTESESDRDVGFSGHSTSSSCPFDTSPAEQEVSGSWVNYPIDWSDTDADSCLHGNNRIDDLIYHFGQFFRGQMDNKLQEMTDFVQTLMSEQQTHVRHIVNTAVTTSQNLVAVPVDQSLASPARKLTRLSSGQRGLGMPVVNTPVLMDMPGTRKSVLVDKSTQVSDDKTMLLLKILATSCSVGSVLLRPEFHT